MIGCARVCMLLSELDRTRHQRTRQGRSGTALCEFTRTFRAPELVYFRAVVCCWQGTPHILVPHTEASI
jgi:hypothetical protein